MKFLPIVRGLLSLLAVGSPTFTFAAVQTPTTFRGLAYFIVQFVGALTALCVGIGVIYFLWGTISSIVDSSSSESRQKFRTQMMWGLIVLTVMFSIWGLLSLLGNTLFGTNNFNAL